MRALESALKAAADPTRTRILKLLEQRDLCVCQIQAILGLAASTVSRHLAVLKAAGLAEDRREGKWIHYGLAVEKPNPHAGSVRRLLGGILDRDPRIAADRRRLREVVRVPVAELCDLVPLPGPAAVPSRPPARRLAGRGRRPHV